MRPGPLEPEQLRLEDFARRLRAHGRVTLSLQVVWKDFAAAFPTRPAGANERTALSEALAALACTGVLHLPAKRGRLWDKTARVLLPRQIRLIHEPRQPRMAEAWQTFPWHPLLAWIPNLPMLLPPHQEFLLKVHRGLVAGTFAEQAPLKYRSLQLLGREKALKQMLSTQLFAPGHLTLEILGCCAEILPLCWEEVGAGPALLLFENSAPFMVARQVLRLSSEHPYGLLAYGAGTRVLTSLAYLALLPREVRWVDYVGDLDREGIRIAVEAQTTAAQARLPPICPATRVHQAMFVAADKMTHPAGFPCPAPRRCVALADGDLLAFLDRDLRASVADLWHRGHRIPEEVLGPQELRHALAPSSMR